MRGSGKEIYQPVLPEQNTKEKAGQSICMPRVQDPLAGRVFISDLLLSVYFCSAIHGIMPQITALFIESTLNLRAREPEELLQKKNKTTLSTFY